MAGVDRALDEVLYRPAVVKAFASLPWWWSCNLAKLSMTLDDRWNVGTGISPESRRVGHARHVDVESRFTSSVVNRAIKPTALAGV